MADRRRGQRRIGPYLSPAEGEPTKRDAPDRFDCRRITKATCSKTGKGELEPWRNALKAVGGGLALRLRKPAIALGRYAPGTDACSCEVAITVGDPWQRRGVGHTLLRRLIVLARRGGYRTMCATALSTNVKMVGLARAFGFDVRREAGGVTAMRLVL